MLFRSRELRAIDVRRQADGHERGADVRGGPGRRDAEAFGETRRLDHAECDRLAVRERAVAEQVLVRVPERVPEVQDGASAFVAFVGADDARLDAAAGCDERGRRGGLERGERGGVIERPVEQRRVRDEGVLERLG